MPCYSRAWSDGELRIGGFIVRASRIARCASGFAECGDWVIRAIVFRVVAVLKELAMGRNLARASRGVSREAVLVVEIRSSCKYNKTTYPTAKTDYDLLGTIHDASY